MKELTFEDTSSGSGWVPVSIELECWECHDVITVTKRQRVAVCPNPECKAKFKIEKGYELYHRLT